MRDVPMSGKDTGVPEAGGPAALTFATRYALAGLHLALKLISWLPSHTIRNLLLRGAFRMDLDATAVLYGGFELRSPWKISIGAGTAIGHRATLDGRRGIRIGRNVNFSSEVMIWTLQHDYRDPHFGTNGGTVSIGDHVWLGPRVIVLPGVTIGEGAVIAAGAVVTRDVEPFVVAAGVPAKPVAARPRTLDYVPSRFVVPFI